MATVSIDLDDLTGLLALSIRSNHRKAVDVLNTALSKAGRPTWPSDGYAAPLPTNHDPAVSWEEQVIARAKTAINAAL